MDTLLLVVHLAAIVVWSGCGLLSHLRLRREADLAPDRRLALRRRMQATFRVEHAALAVVLVSGAILMGLRGWGIGRARWLTLKLGLVGFLIVPLEALHAFACHVWIARGLRRTEGPALDKDLVRGAGMEEMARTLAVLLLGLTVPFLIWLSIAQPF